MPTSIRISSLDVLPVVTRNDFLPIVQSGSAPTLTTYRTPLSAVNDFFSIAGSVLSASFASSSISASHARLSDSASYLYPTFVYNATVTASVSSSWSAVAFSSSYAKTASVSFTSSYARLSDSASYLYPTFVYNATVSSSVSASWARTSSWAQNGLVTGSTYPVTSSWAISASFSPTQVNPGIITAYAGTTAPAGWLKCDGTLYSAVTYADLAAVIGVNYGLPFTTSIMIRAETPNAYGTNNDGKIYIKFGNGGSGLYSVSSGSSTVFAQSGSTVALLNLDARTYSDIVIKNLDVSPVLSFTTPMTVPYGPANSSTTASTTFGTQQNRLPNLVDYYTINAYPLVIPLIYVIKT